MAYAPQRRVERPSNSGLFYVGTSAWTSPVVKKESMEDLLSEAFKAHRNYSDNVLTEKLSSIARRMEASGHVSRWNFQGPTVVNYGREVYDLALRSEN